MQRKMFVYLLTFIILIFGFDAVVFAYEDVACGTAEGGYWGLPLSNIKVNSPFNPPSHYGVDYKAADGDNVLAVADGKISKIGYDLKQLPKPNLRTGLMTQGWGRYVVVEHTGGPMTLYAHLQTDSTANLQEGQIVTKGTVIGKADSSGGVTGPHLHLEYSPGGLIFDSSAKIDPLPCTCKSEEMPPLTITGHETITTNSSAQYTATGCPSNVTWSVSGTGATISSTGLLTAGATACGSLTVTATCAGCGTSATQYARVTDAGAWEQVSIINYGCGSAYSASIVCTSGNKQLEYDLFSAGAPDLCNPCSSWEQCLLYAGCNTLPPGGGEVSSGCILTLYGYGFDTTVCIYPSHKIEREWRCL